MEEGAEAASEYLSSFLASSVASEAYPSAREVVEVAS